MEAEDAPPFKKSQRPVVSCSSCYKRKVKCNKEMPCAQCVKRGESDLCHWETRIVRGTAKSAAPASPRPLTEQELLAELTTIKRKVRSQDQLIANLQAALANKQGSGAASSLPERDLSREGSSRDREGSAADGAADGGHTAAGEVISADSIVLGVHMPPPLSDLKLAPRNPTTWTPPWSRAATSAKYVPLIPFAVSRVLLQTYLNVSHWLGGTVHPGKMMVLHDDMLSALSRNEEVRCDILALYFSLIAGALHFVQEETALSFGFTLEQINLLPKLWFEASLECLHSSDFLGQPSLEALQTISKLPMTGNTYAATSHVASLSAVGISLACTLGMHRLGPEDLASPAPGFIERELGRRLWVALMIGESLSPNSHRPFALYLSQAQTSEPLNVDLRYMVDGEPLRPQPLNEFTDASHLIAMHRLTILFRAFNLAFWHLSTAEQLKLADETHVKLVHILDFCPALKRSEEPYPTTVSWTSSFDYLPWARLMWAFVIPAKRILLYRSFVGRSYTDPRYARAREICLESARAILAERRRPVPALYLKPWSFTSDTVLAGAVLATEYANSSDEKTRTALHIEILEAIELLKITPHNLKTMWSRGVEMLEQAIASVHPPPTDWDSILFDPTVDWFNSIGTSSALYDWPPSSIDADPVATDEFAWQALF